MTTMHTFKFKPLKEADLETLYNWFQEPTIKQLYVREQHFSLDAIHAKYRPRIVGEEHIPSFIIYRHNLAIGFIQYYIISEHLPEGILNYSNPLFKKCQPEHTVGVDCFIASSNDRGRGLGAQMINDFIAKFLMNFSKIIVDPNRNNTQAIRCYEKAGFEASTYSENDAYIVYIASPS